jgi:hypothetical protein
MLKTKDLALATTLRVHDHEPLRMELNDDKEAVWVFNGASEAIAALYHAGEARVEPRKYNLTLRKTRDELFRYLNRNGINPRARRR